MFQKQKGMDQMLQAALVTMLAGNSQEHTEVNVHTQARVPFVQALLVMVAIVVALGGIWLLSSGLIVLARRSNDRWDMILAAGGLWAIAGLWMVLGSKIVSRLKFRTQIAARGLLLAGAFVGTLATLDVIQLATAGGFTLNDGLRTLGGLAFTVGAALLIWRLANELINPLYPRPPSIDLLREMREPGEPRVIKVPTPVHLNGEAMEDFEEREGEEDKPDYVSDHELLMAFVERAATIGLVRTQWLNPGAPEFLAGREVTRGLYNQMIYLAGRWRIVRPGGGGVAAQWAMEPAEALEVLQIAWDTVGQRRAGGQAAGGQAAQ